MAGEGDHTKAHLQMHVDISQCPVYHLQSKQPDCPENLRFQKLSSHKPWEKNITENYQDKTCPTPDKHKVLGSVLHWLKF